VAGKEGGREGGREGFFLVLCVCTKFSASLVSTCFSTHPSLPPSLQGDGYKDYYHESKLGIAAGEDEETHVIHPFLPSSLPPSLRVMVTKTTTTSPNWALPPARTRKRGRDEGGWRGATSKASFGC